MRIRGKVIFFKTMEHIRNNLRIILGVNVRLLSCAQEVRKYFSKPDALVQMYCRFYSLTCCTLVSLTLKYFIHDSKGM